MSYDDDARVRGGERARQRKFDAAKMTLLYEVPATDEELDVDGCGDDVEITLPARFEVCPTCEGKGRHVNPSIDAHGLTREETDSWCAEELEGYFQGRYDVECYECAGQRVVPEIDEGKALKSDLTRVQQHLRERAELDAEERHERRMGY